MPSAASNLDALVASGHTIASLEASLGLSAGYLSKVRHGSVRPSAQLTALLQVVRVHPETLATVTSATRAARSRAGAPKRSEGAQRSARDALSLVAAARVRWAICGRTALRLHGAPIAAEPGVDILVDDRDRHVLEALRVGRYRPVHRSPALSVCHLDPDDPNESLRVHFPSTPPLTSALDAVTLRDLGGLAVPVVDLVTLTVADLLSRRSGSDDAVAAALAIGVSTQGLAERLDALDALAPTKSPYVLRVFDRDLARSRLDRLRGR
jgi:hypothetical protein